MAISFGPEIVQEKAQDKQKPQKKDIKVNRRRVGQKELSNLQKEADKQQKKSANKLQKVEKP